MMKAFKTLLRTEARLSLRGMDMVIFALCMPVAAMLILGMVYGNKPAFAGAEYTFLAQSFGAVATIAICAGGLMGLPLVIADYRSRKILKRYRVTPVRPVLILAVQGVIYALYAVGSLLLVYAVGATGFGFRLRGSWLQFLGAYLLVMGTMFSVGLLVGGLSPNTKIASVAASLLYFPTLLLSGATLPYEVMPRALQTAADLLPLTQGIKLMKAASLGLPISGVLLPFTEMVVLAVVCTSLSIRFFRWE